MSASVNSYAEDQILENLSEMQMTISLGYKLPYIKFEPFAAVTMKNAVFLDVMPCGFCRNRRFRGTYRLHHQGGTYSDRCLSQTGKSCDIW
jgi:hypothetical protein